MKVPSPIGGLNFRDAKNRLPPTDAKKLDNWIPDSGYCRIRESGSEQANVGPAIIPECAPYDCEAYEDQLAEYDMDTLVGWSLSAEKSEHVNPFFPNSEWQGFFSDGSGTATWLSDHTDSVLVSADPAIDPCGGPARRTVRWNSTVSDRTVVLQKNDVAEFNTVAMVIEMDTLRSSVLTGGGEFQLIRVGRNYKVTRPSGGDLSFRPTIDIYAQRYTPAGGASLSGIRVRVLSDGFPDTWTDLGAAPSGPAHLTVYAVADGPGWVYQDNSPFTNRYFFTISNLKVVVNIVPLSGAPLTYSVPSTTVQTVNGYFDFGEGPPTFIPQPSVPTTNCQCFTGARLDLYEFGAVDTIEPVDTDALALAFKRNRTDYEPPGYCGD